MSYNVTKLKINCYFTIQKNCNIYFIIIMSIPLAGGTIGSCYCLLQVVCCFSSLSHFLMFQFDGYKQPDQSSDK